MRRDKTTKKKKRVQTDGEKIVTGSDAYANTPRPLFTPAVQLNPATEARHAKLASKGAKSCSGKHYQGCQSCFYYHRWIDAEEADLSSAFVTARESKSMQFNQSINMRFSGGRSTSKKRVKIMLVVDAPHAKDDGFKKLGASGVSDVVKTQRLILQLGEEYGISKSDIRIASIAKCAHKGAGDLTETRAFACSGNLAEDIQAHDPVVIVPIGTLATKLLTGNPKANLTTMVGNSYEYEIAGKKRLIFPVWAYNYVYAYNDHLKDQYKEALGSLICHTVGFVEHKKPDVFKEHILRTIPEIVRAMKKLEKQNKNTVFDWETNTLKIYHHPEPRITCFGFANEEKEYYVIPFEHKDSPFKNKPKARRKIIKIVNKFMKSQVPKIAHNAKYDINTAKSWYGITTRNLICDTMFLSHLVDENRPKALKHLTHVYTSNGGYSDAMEAKLGKDKDYANIPGSELYPYCGKDNCNTLQIYNRMNEELSEDKLAGLMVDLDQYMNPQATVALASVEHNGACIQPEWAEYITKIYKKKIKHEYKAITKDRVVKKYIKHRKMEYECKGKKADAKNFEFKVGSPEQLKDIFFGRQPDKEKGKLRFRGYKQTPTVFSKTNKDSPSTDDYTMQLLDKGGIELAGHIRRWRSSAKLYGTYVEPLLAKALLHVDNENREGSPYLIHPSFLLTGTVTGRLCVDGDTLLATSSGNYNIKDLGPVLESEPCVTIRTHTGLFKKILGLYYKGREEMYRVTAQLDSRDIICTENHRFYTNHSDWTHLKDLAIGDSISVNVAGNLTYETTLKNIEPVGIRDVWDIQVEGDHSYVAHGFINHNSCREPNFQNIPNKGGGSIKRMFISRFGIDKGVLVDADYSQIELRLLGIIAKDKEIIGAYQRGEDLHMKTCLQKLNISLKEYYTHDKLWQKEERTKAKRVNFGIIYGIGAKGIVDLLEKDGVVCTQEEAEDYITAFSNLYVRAWKWMRSTENQLELHGYVESLFGRRRRLEKIKSAHISTQNRAKRQSINHPVQSTASDITLTSLILIDRELKKRKLRSVLAITVHDSIIVDCPNEEAEEVIDLMFNIMSQIITHGKKVMPNFNWKQLKKVPILADVEAGVTWRDVKPCHINDENADKYKDEGLKIGDRRTIAAILKDTRTTQEERDAQVKREFKEFKREIKKAA